jgi:hypothetical protein
VTSAAAAVAPGAMEACARRHMHCQQAAGLQDACLHAFQCCVALYTAIRLINVVRVGACFMHDIIDAGVLHVILW